MKEKQNYFYCTADINNSQISHFQSKETPESQTVSIGVSWELTAIYYTELKMSSLWNSNMRPQRSRVQKSQWLTCNSLYIAVLYVLSGHLMPNPVIWRLMHWGLQSTILGDLFEKGQLVPGIKFEVLGTPDTNSSSMTFLSGSCNKIFNFTTKKNVQLFVLSIFK